MSSAVAAIAAKAAFELLLLALMLSSCALTAISSCACIVFISLAASSNRNPHWDLQVGVESEHACRLIIPCSSALGV